MSAGFIRYRPDSEFDGRLRVVHRAVAAAAERVKTRWAQDLLAETAEATPVRTGRARAGWHLSRDPNSDWTPGRAEGREPAEFMGPGDESGAPVYLVNNVEYIMALEMGRSDQAPAGMVRAAVETLRVRADRTLDLSEDGQGGNP